VKLTTHLLLLPRLRISAAVSTPPYAFMAWTKKMYVLLLLLLLLFTAIEFSPGGSSPYTSTNNKNGHINIHKNNNTKQTIHNYKTKYIQ
jgi:hypothetical protein